MSLITRCPACGTMFKVVPDQLRISQGWVRCGHCAEVFDASAHLQDREPAAPATTPAAAQASAASAIASLGQARLLEKAKQEALEQALAEEVALALAGVPDMQDSEGAADSPLYPPFSLLRADSEVDALAEAAAQAKDKPVLPEPAPVSRATAAPSPKPAKAANRGVDQLDDVSFVRQARRKAFWRRPAVRALLLMIGLGLAALLAGQYAVYDRDRLAVRLPELRPVLDALCGPLQCAVGPPRQIESIVIDSSSFNKLRGDAYRLSFTLKNLATVPVAMPAMELTLTDSQDQPVVRRVLAPADLGASSSVLAAASEWSGTLAMGVTANGASARIAGYRLLAFYP
ncbi:MAG: DUF3426 domain-containing protein [Ramlibacter sp.]